MDKMKNIKKTFVLDTTVIIDDPEIIYHLGGIGVEIVVPIAAIKELDGLKKSPHEMVARAARAFADEMARLGEYLDLAAGGQLRTGAILRIETGYEPIDALASAADNKIVGTAVKLKREGRKVTLLSTDNYMRTAARAYGVKAEVGVGYGRVDEKITEKDFKEKKSEKTMKKEPKREFRDLAEEELYNEMIAMGLDPDEKMSFGEIVRDATNILRDSKHSPKKSLYNPLHGTDMFSDPLSPLTDFDLAGLDGNLFEDP